MERYTADFETTVDEFDCRVWAFSSCNIDDFDDVDVGQDIGSFFRWAEERAGSRIYFHNLKFDGEYILNWLFDNGFTWVPDKREATDRTFTTLISDSNQWYSIGIYFTSSKHIEIMDSLKIIPLKVEKVAKAFGLPISKLTIDYAEYRPVGHVLTPEEDAYCRNDVIIMAMALKIMLDQGLTKMTIGSNAMSDFKKSVGGNKRFRQVFPTPDYDADVRQSYRGGFTYVAPRYQGRVLGRGIVLDVNSLYPSRMYSCMLPYGDPVRFDGAYDADDLRPLYVQMLRADFKLKKDHIPCVQIHDKSSPFLATEYVTDSDGPRELCLTNVDLDLFFQQYDVFSIDYHCGWKFKATDKMFRDFIDKWIAVKNQATIDGNAGLRQVAKLMLNSLYGKFATNPLKQSRYPMQVDGIMSYNLLPPEDCEPIYVPVGTFITSHARYMTITSAQREYDRFAYADTDSLHLLGTDEPSGLEIDPVKLGAWKHESDFARAKFLRAKCYVEEEVGASGLTVHCAGMPDKCHEGITVENFEIGGKYPGKLFPKHVKGGIILREGDYTIRRSACYV